MGRRAMSGLGDILVWRIVGTIAVGRASMALVFYSSRHDMDRSLCAGAPMNGPCGSPLDRGMALHNAVTRSSSLIAPRPQKGMPRAVSSHSCARARG